METEQKELIELFKTALTQGMMATEKTSDGTYSLPGRSAPTPEDVFTAPHKRSDLSSKHKGMSSAHKDTSSAHKNTSSEHKDTSSEPKREPERDEYGRLISDEFNYPLVDKLEAIEGDYKNKLLDIARLPRQKGRLNPHILQDVILELCKGQYVTLNVLGKIVNRNPDGLRQRYLKNLIKDEKLKMAFPSTPNDERQAYIAKLDN